MPNYEPKSKVTLEDLLRLKRAERPGPEFWTNFDHELHQKQLTALVKKRRWWHDMPLLLGRRVFIPAGATAIVAFSLVTVRYTATSRVAELSDTESSMVAADSAIETLAPTIVAGFETTQTEKYEKQVAAVAAIPDIEIDGLSELLPVMLVPTKHETPSARSIAANLARLEQSEPELVNSVMGNRLSSPARFQTVASVQPELEQSTTSDNSRKYRLIARYAERALSPEPSAPAPTRERIARRLGDDLGDGISRIGVVGSRVSLKF